MKAVPGRLGSVALVAAVLVVGVFAAAGAASTDEATAKTTVAVTASEFKFVLSKRSVAAGTVTFKVVNKGKVPHDFKIAGKKTPLLASGKSSTLTVTLKKGKKYPYLCTVPGHAAAGMKGVLKVT